MRTPEEVRKVIDYLASSARGAKALHNVHAVEYALIAVDILCWVLGEESPFGGLVKEWDESDRAADKHTRN